MQEGGFEPPNPLRDRISYVHSKYLIMRDLVLSFAEPQ